MRIYIILVQTSNISVHSTYTSATKALKALDELNKNIKEYDDTVYYIESSIINEYIKQKKGLK